MKTRPLAALVLLAVLLSGCGTLLALHDAGFSGDEAVDWLLNENDELGERPIAALNAGRKSAVRRATQALAF